MKVKESLTKTIRIARLRWFGLMKKITQQTIEEENDQGKWEDRH